MNHFNVGDRVKLKDYGFFGDYETHRDAECIIIDYFSGEKNGIEFNWRVSWDDGTISCVADNNCLPIQWDLPENAQTKKERR